MVSVLIAVVAAVAAVAGLTLLVVELLTERADEPRPRTVSRWLPRRGQGDAGPSLLRIVIPPGLGLLAWLISGWPVAALIVTAAAIGLPRLLVGAAADRRRIARLEALESWSRRLADLRAAGSGLEQVLEVSVRTCPEPIRPEVTLLVARLKAGWSTEAALFAFAEDVGELSADLVVAVLTREAQRRGGGLTAALTDLADTVAEEVDLRRRVDAERAKPRTSARWLTAITVAVAAFGSLNHAYIRPYGTPFGQLVLAMLAAAFASCLWWMHTIAAGVPEPRLLGSERPGGRS